MLSLNTVHSRFLKKKKTFWFLDGQLVLLVRSQPLSQAPLEGVHMFGGGFLRYWVCLGRGGGGGRGRLYGGSSPSRMVFRCPGGGKVNLLFEPSLHFGEEEGERAAQREGGRRLAGRAGLRKQESRGGATGERGRSCQRQGAVREEQRGACSHLPPRKTGSEEIHTER